MSEQTKTKRVKPILGGILSGGYSSRMGQPKDRILLADGRPMIQHVLDTLLSVCNEVIVSGPEIPVELNEDERVQFIKDNFPGKGPLAGIEAILSTGKARGYLIVACDQPLLKEELLRALVPNDRDVPCFFDLSESGYIQPFPGYYPVSWLPDIRDSLRRNRRAIKSLIADSDVILKDIDPNLKKYIRSINTQEDLLSLNDPECDAAEQNTDSKHQHDKASCRISGHDHQ
ncbi:MAG: molybdenum cofactor guanylyltransferase [Candidatus Obscuribacterales bacterium]|nr:molybdenum cofactor guanylyltransferase [Candidatus Obscuribacterales bacterium]